MALVAKVEISKDNLIKQITTKITREEKGTINRDYAQAIGKIADKMVGTGAGKDKSTIASAVKRAAVQEIVAGLGTVNSLLKTGIQGGQTGNAGFGFAPLTKSWVKRKRAGSRNLFWKNKGDLALGFNNFYLNYSRALSGAETIVSPRVGKNRYGMTSFTYRISIQLPKHAEGFITDITRNSFVRAVAYKGRGYSLQDLGASRPRTFAKIGLLEGEGRYHRPFIAKIMAYRGAKFNERLHKIIQGAVHS